MGETQVIHSAKLDMLRYMLQRLIAVPQLLALVIVIDVAAYFGGLLYWYGYVMSDATTPIWVWPFIPDCPLFGLLGGMALLMVTSRDFWSPSAQQRAQRALWIGAVLSLVLWVSTYVPIVGEGWSKQSAMFGVWSWVLVLGAVFFRTAPAWFLGIVAFGQIKYGIWTVTAWLLFWQNTATAFGSPLFTFDSVFMTITHIGLIVQGLVLLTYFRPTLGAAFASVGWFALSDFIDYGLGYYPAIPEQWIPIAVMKWSTIAVTGLIGLWYFWMGLRRGARSDRDPMHDQASPSAA